MTRQVNEDIDSILVDQVGGLGVGEPDERTPMVSVVLQASRDFIGPRHVGVAADLEVLMVVRGEDRFQEIDDRVLAVVG